MIRPTLTKTRIFSLALFAVALPLYFLVFGAIPAASEYRSTQPAIIIDLGGVLMETKKLTSAKFLGLKQVIWYYFSSGKSTKNIRLQFYAALNNISGTAGNSCGARDDEGNLMPEMMCAWLRGSRTSKDLLQTTRAAIRAHPEWFDSEAEQIIVQRLANIIFTPEIFAQTQQPIQEGIKFVKACKKRGYLVYVLSNWDNESFDLIVKEYQDFFKLFDGIIISGDVHLIKPDSEIYTQFTNRIMPSNCVFIDDRIENIQAARKNGIFGIHCKQIKSTFGFKPDFKHVRKSLYDWEKTQFLSS